MCKLLIAAQENSPDTQVNWRTR